MKARQLLQAKTAADIIGRSKEAVDDEEKGALDTLKERFKATDPRMWSTPTGLVAGLALTHALTDPKKRTRLKYLAGGAGGAAAGYGLGQGLLSYSPAYRDLRMGGVKYRPDERRDTGSSFNPSVDVVNDLDKLDRYALDWLVNNPEVITDPDSPELDRFVKAMKSHRLGGNKTLWDTYKPNYTGFSTFTEPTKKWVNPLNYFKSRRDAADRRLAIMHLAGVLENVAGGSDREDSLRKIVQEARKRIED